MVRCRLTRNASAGLNLSVTADAVPPPLTRGGFGIPQSFASSPEAPLPGELSNEVRLRGWTKDDLAGKLLLGSTSPSRLTPCHLPYRGEALAFRKASPLRQRLPYQGQRRRPPPAAETGRSCWGSGQQDASGSAADAGSRNPGAKHLWRDGQAHAGRAKFLYIENSSALLQRAAASEQYPCQAAADLCSRALFFTLY